MKKSGYSIRQVGKNWEVIHMATGRSIGQRYTRDEARKLRARHDNLDIERRNREELDAAVR